MSIDVHRRPSTGFYDTSSSSGTRGAIRTNLAISGPSFSDPTVEVHEGRRISGHTTVPRGLLPKFFFAQGFFARSSTDIIPDTSIVRIIHLRLDISEQVLWRLPSRKPAIVKVCPGTSGGITKFSEHEAD